MTEAQNVTLNKRYQLINRVGSGGMAVVYKAKDLALGRLVAVKMLHDSLTGDNNFLASFRREAHAAANLAHPNIVTVYDIGEAEHRHFIVLEFIDGQTLKQIIRQHKANGTYLPLTDVLTIVIQICEGIGCAHRADLVHCDVKPQNVRITRDQRVKVADFGIARAVSEATISQQSRSWGTPQYFSPEQAAGEKPTPASDVYSIGIILFEMLTNELPFQAETPTGLAIKHLQTPPPLVTELNPLVPPQLAQIVNKVLSKEPSGRARSPDQTLRPPQPPTPQPIGRLLAWASPPLPPCWASFLSGTKFIWHGCRRTNLSLSRSQPTSLFAILPVVLTCSFPPSYWRPPFEYGKNY